LLECALFVGKLFYAQNADAVVVGSAVVNQIAENGKSKDLASRAGKFVKSLTDA
jgi:tryptophan synthase alpha subunit